MWATEKRVQKKTSAMNSSGDFDTNNEGLDIKDDDETGYVNQVLGIRWNEKHWRLEHRVEWKDYEGEEHWHPHGDILSYPKEHGVQEYLLTSQ